MAGWTDACVLIVDDEPDIVDAIGAVFEAQGCRRILKASDGLSGFGAFLQHDVDLVVSDIRMPRSDGIELLKNIKRVRPDFTGVYLMTGYSDARVDELLRLGARAVFKKPFDVDALLEAMAERVAAVHPR
jgi:DNA-binding NtrC family response regulator